eukprot:TRINITY_DN110817_c0_g1_i1.p1 TRINITY_DN110817_c0_g1~~TRINITY_DN110817_c0_g1_i1.p1  ORF type:complete len:634 (-),score=86.20 TRINITY_DN110817_c0_g1_i1:46-1947(-)
MAEENGYRALPASLPVATVPLVVSWTPREQQEASILVLLFASTCCGYAFLTRASGGWVAVLALVATGVPAARSIKGAFFPRYDHPLHQLDRARWSLSFFSCFILLCLTFFGGGCVYLWSLFAPAIHMDVQQFSQSLSSFDGFVYLRFAKVDVARSGFATVCSSSCSAYECAHYYDCRSYLPLADDHLVMILDGQLLELDSDGVLDRAMNVTSFSGAGAAGGGGSSATSSCSVSCMYAAPIVDKDGQWKRHADIFGAEKSSVANQKDAGTTEALAWALSLYYPATPKYVGGELVGTQNLELFDFDARARNQAIDEAVASQLPSCNGSQVVSSPTWFKSCRSEGFVDCGYDHAGKCCCPVGYRATDGPDCSKCDDVVKELRAMRSKPIIYSMDPEDGLFDFYLMLVCAMSMLPFPWLIYARSAWPKAWETSRQDFKEWYYQYLRAEYAFQRPEPASFTGPESITVFVTKLSGESRELGGFAGSSLLGELRQAVAEEFAMNFPQVGLVFQAELLNRDADFRRFAELGIESQAEISVVQSTEPEPTVPLRDQLVGTYENDAFAFFARDRAVYMARTCRHNALQAVVCTPALGRSYEKGWICDGCMTKFPLNSTMRQCHACQVDFCQACMTLRDGDTQ